MTTPTTAREIAKLALEAAQQPDVGIPTSEKMRQFVTSCATCPACKKTYVCSENCSFEYETHAEWFLVECARDALKESK